MWWKNFDTNALHYHMVYGKMNTQELKNSVYLISSKSQIKAFQTLSNANNNGQVIGYYE